MRNGQLRGRAPDETGLSASAGPVVNIVSAVNTSDAKRPGAHVQVDEEAGKCL